MRTIHLPKALSILLFAAIALLIGMSCSKKIVNPEPEGNVSIELRSGPNSTSLGSVVSLVVLTIWGEDMDSITDSLTYDGTPLVFVHSVEAGTARHFLVRAYAENRTNAAYTLIYEGAATVDITGDAKTTVTIMMQAMVPIIRAFPHKADFQSGVPFAITVESFRMPGLRIAEFQLTASRPSFYVDGIDPGRSIDTPADTFYPSWEGSWNDVYIHGAGPIAEADGYTQLAILRYESPYFVGDSDVIFTVTPVTISDSTLFNTTPYFESSDVVVHGLPDRMVSFPDSTLARLISSQLQKPGQLYLSDVLKVYYISAGEAGVVDLTGINDLKNLDYLWLNANPIEDISPISGMTKLVYVNFGWCNISSIAGLHDLPALYSLALDHNQITDLSPFLSNNVLTAGDTLDVSYNPLDANSINVVIPALKNHGIRVGFIPPGL